MISFDPHFLKWLGRTFGKDEGNYLVCSECDERFDFPWEPDRCTKCGGELHVHLPDSEMMVIRWRAWKSKQRWWPQKFYVWSSGESYQEWCFLGRKWFKKSRPKPDWWPEEE